MKPDRQGEPAADEPKYGGIVHIYQKYDPQRFPSPTQPPADFVSPAFEHFLRFGGQRPLTPEELARAIRLDPSQIQGLGPSIESLLALLRERKDKILRTYETDQVVAQVQHEWRQAVQQTNVPRPFRDLFNQAVQRNQRYLLERLWYAQRDDQSRFAQQLVRLMERLGDRYEIEELATRYEFRGTTELTVPQALEVKAELEKIETLIEQLLAALENAQLAVVDLSALEEFAEPGQVDELRKLQEQVEQILREQARAQGLEPSQGQFRLTPQSYRLFQGRLLERIFRQLQPSRSGRHAAIVDRDGAVELPATRPYQFGDSLTQLDLPQSILNSMIRAGTTRPITLRPDDLEVHRTRNQPKCASVVVMDMSGSMRYDGQYINVKRMALALEGLIRREYPGDFLRFVEMYSFARLCPAGEIINLMPKPVTLFDPVVQLRADMSRPDLSESMVHPHFTNLQHALQMSRRLLATQDTPNKQILVITDGLPTAHFEGSWLYLLYPPHERTEELTLREGIACAREGITINLFVIPSWSQSAEDIRFAHRLVESTKGRVFFTGGRDLDRFVIWDYVQHKREIIG